MSPVALAQTAAATGDGEQQRGVPMDDPPEGDGAGGHAASLGLSGRIGSPRAAGPG